MIGRVDLACLKRFKDNHEPARFASERITFLSYRVLIHVTDDQ
ncbi:hypothetical protein PSCLAVI8L_270016 [Pseudoclavibacter sp. 8L]|nr:hypothetical protein PSCLAVI8L_270016 [Pseudoclavibacter sp. 8L]